MNRLKDHTSYLIGPMDDNNEASRGSIWRNTASQFLWDLGIGVLNPCDKPSTMGSEDDETFKLMNQKKLEGDYDFVSRTMTPIVRIDLHMVDTSNFSWMKVNKDTHMCGSYGEQTYAALEKKPIVVWCPQGKHHVPNWLFGMGMRHQMFFGSLEESMNYIRHIHEDESIDPLGRWRFIDYDKVFNRQRAVQGVHRL